MGEDVKDSIIQKTQKSLGKYITKPTLTPKLLKKPPFRFLHDIVTSVIKETDFLKGLFSEEEMISENVKDRDAKIAFLTKLINALGVISGHEVDVKPSKIVAGLEATKTNKMLQILGNCLEKKLDSKDYISKLKSGGKVEKVTKSNKAEKSSKASKDAGKVDSDRKTEKPLKTQKKAVTSKVSVEKISKTSVDSTRKNSINKIGKKKEKEKSKKAEEPKEVVQNIETNLETKAVLEESHEEEAVNNVEDDVTVKEKKSQKVNEVSNEDQTSMEMETKGDELKVEEQTVVTDEGRVEVRPKSPKIQPNIAQDTVEKQKELFTGQTNFLRPPSVRPMSARPGAPRLRPESTLPTDQIIPLGNINVIVENYNNQDDEETVVIQNVELPQEQPSVEDVLNIPQDKGHLVEQILEQINHTDDLMQVKDDRENDNLILDTHNRSVIQKEIHHLQNLVQTLTKVANPLGKLMNYLHEDLDGMHSELIMWINMKKQAYAEIKKQKEQQITSNTVLKQQLADVEENIKKIESEITYVQANVLKNEIRIKQLLTR